MTRDTPRGEWVVTDVPGRLDALTWSRWHQRMVLALGITWILDGLEASLVANVAPTLRDPAALGLSATAIGIANSAYLVGQVLGALCFGHLTDRFGRKRLFLVTLAIYLGATAASGLAPSYAVFVAFRFLAGSGIGGEYSAINSAIDELVPARVRGTIDLAINGSYWVGVALGASITLIVLDTRLFLIGVGWRIAFGFGAVLGLAIIFVRRHLPESPRWLLSHGFVRQAVAVVEHIEAQVYGAGSHALARVTAVAAIRVQVTGTVGLRHLAHTLLRRYPRRTILGLSLRHADARVDGRLLRSVGGGELGVSHRERALSRGAARHGDRRLLCVRHARWRRRTGDLRRHRRYRRPIAAVRRLRAGGQP